MGTDRNKKFSEKETQKAEQHLKKCSISIAIREIQPKLSEISSNPIRMAMMN